MEQAIVESAIEKLIIHGEVIKLKDADSASNAIYCNRKVFDRIKKKTVVLARSDIKPKEPEIYCSYLLEHHGIGVDILPPEEKLENTVAMLQGYFLPVAWWEDFVFPSRVKKYDAKMLDYLCSSGVVRWAGRTNKSTREAAFYLLNGLEENIEQEEYIKPQEFTLDRLEEDVCGILREKGACFLKDLSKYMGIAAGELLSKLERLVWSGIITNDAFSVARYFIDLEKKNSPWIKYNTYPNMGRWYLTGEASLPRNEKGLKVHINRLLDRYGIISKNIADCEKEIFKWGDIYSYLKNSEFSSGIKRGFYISGLAGIQFARDKDLELIRMQDSQDKEERYVTLCICDPANPYKDLLSKVSTIKAPKNQGTAVVFANGLPVMVLRDFGSSIVPLTEDRDVVIKAAKSFVEAFASRSLWTAKKSIFTEFWGEKAAEEICRIEDSPVYEELLDMGFDRGYSGITLWRRV